MHNCVIHKKKEAVCRMSKTERLNSTHEKLNLSIVIIGQYSVKLVTKA